MYLGRFRSFHKGSIGSVDKRAAKLPAIKFGGLKKSLPLLSLQRAQACSARVRLCPGMNHSQTLRDGNFLALSPTDPILPVWKDINPLDA